MIYKFVALEEVERAIFAAAKEAWKRAGGDGLREPAEVAVGIVNDLRAGKYEAPLALTAQLVVRDASDD